MQKCFDPTVRLFKPEDNLASPFVFPEIMRFQTSFVKIGLENYLRTVALSLRTYRLLVYPTERTKDRIFYDSDWISWLRFESWVRHFVKLLSKSHKIGLPSRVIWVVVVILWICSVLTKDHTPVIIVSALLRAKIWVSQVHWKFRPK